jgi:5S rRNA maturation endonuclease (ribonuclease M5)
MIAKINRKRQHTIVTFVIEGKEDKSAVTISFIPGFLEIILSGLRALSALKALRDYRLEAIFESLSLSRVFV